MKFTQRQIDRTCTTVFCGSCGSLIGLCLLWADGTPWFAVPIVAFYTAWGTSGFDISKR